MIVFLDIDEVLVDFLGAAIRVHGWDREELLANWPDDTWGAHEVLGISQRQFWKPINEAGAHFWENLEEKPWMDELLMLLSLVFPEKDGHEHYLVSDPSLCPTSYTGKVNWIHNRFGQGFNKFILTPHKELLAGPDRLLIDDRPQNVTKFNERGGHGILFPFHGNGLRRRLADPIGYMRDRLDWYREYEVSHDPKVGEEQL